MASFTTVRAESSTGARVGTARRAHRITDWNPEDDQAWAAGNAAIARRNLIWSTATMHIAFSIWSLWSVVVLFMPQSVYGLTPGDKLLLAAIATLVGGAVRIPYTIATARFGGRNWAVLSSLVLVIPTVGTLLLLINPGRPLWMYLVCAALTGLGGGNYSAALANVDAFYPHRLKGAALGLTGGIGNLGVAAIQLVGLLVLSTLGSHAAYWVCAIYLALLAIAGVGAALRMDNLDCTAESGSLRAILSVPDTWVICALYSVAFGSFIGFSFAFAQVLHVTFQDGGLSPAQASLYAARIAFVGPLLAAVTRIYGGWLADRRGGGPVTCGVFVGMISVAGALIATSIHDDRSPGAVSGVDVAGYLAAFLALFALAGMGNGSVFKMIPSVFEKRSYTMRVDETERRRRVHAQSGALIGLATAVGALGGVGINLMLRQSYAASGTETPAFWVFLACYAGAAILTWAKYVRGRRVRPVAGAGIRGDDHVR